MFFPPLWDSPALPPTLPLAGVVSSSSLTLIALLGTAPEPEPRVPSRVLFGS